MTASALAEAELHGLVDGRVAPGRRADLLRRLAGSPADRLVVEAWQDQGDLLREAFREVPTEALPAALDLAPPRLRSVDVNRAHKTSASKAPVRHGGGAAITAALVITIGLTLSWMAGFRDDSAAPAHVATAADDRTAALPSFHVPDLSATGLRLTDVSSDAVDPASVVLRYRDRGAGRVSLQVARNAPDVGPTPLEQAGQTMTWRSQTAAFTLDGTIPAARLRAVASALQADQGSD